jgi:hypothetical protein
MFLKIIIYIFFIVSLFSISANAENSECSAKEDKVLCMALEGDTMAMYVMGRREYTIARKTGDMTKALNWTLKVLENKDSALVASRLLKMIYIQLGEGVHKDYVQAYIWLQEGINKGDDYVYLIRWQERLTYYMSEQQINDARKILYDMSKK